jgi:hypothetical protein
VTVRKHPVVSFLSKHPGGAWHGNMRVKIAKLFQAAREKVTTLLGHRPFQLLLGTLLLAGFLYEPIWFGRRIQPSEHSPDISCSDPKDRQSSGALRLRAAWEAEREGDVDAAQKQYLAAVDSTTACVRDAARLAIDRLSLQKDKWGLAYGVLADWAHISSELRTSLVFAYLALLAYLLLSWFIPRKGIRIGKFPVHGTSHPAAAELFADSLVSFTATIRRAYDADYLRRAGLTALFEDLTGPTIERADDFEKALADAGESNLRSVVLLAFKAFNFIRRLSERPRFRLEGNVYCLPGTARVTAVLNDLTKRKSKEVHFDATLAELDAIPSPAFVREALIHPAVSQPWATQYTKGEDLRYVTQQLHGLALVLASKVRSTQLQAKEAGYRPRDWVVVCLFTAAAAHLED